MAPKLLYFLWLVPSTLGALAWKPVEGLAIWGLSDSSCPSCGYVVIELEFPEDVAGVQRPNARQRTNHPPYVFHGLHQKPGLYDDPAWWSQVGGARGFNYFNWLWCIHSLQCGATEEDTLPGGLFVHWSDVVLSIRVCNATKKEIVLAKRQFWPRY